MWKTLGGIDLTLPKRGEMNTSAASQLNFSHPAFTYSEMLARNPDKSGDALFKRLIDASVEDTKILHTVSSTIGCFVAGTLVHTKEGLVPIEKVRVGDWVLSKSEDGDGDVTYKQVNRTFRFDDKPITIVSYYIVDPSLPEGGEIETLAVTGNHPFWIVGEGWRRADQIGDGHRFVLSDGRSATVICSKSAYRSTNDSERGWVEGYVDTGKSNDWSGVDFIIENGNVIEVIPSAEHYLNQNIAAGREVYFTASVFNLEVSDTHTYFVGKLGVWVHNTNCGDLSVSIVENSHGIAPSLSSRLYKNKFGNAIA